ncbi:DNA polymerase III subunit beta [bacterium]|nr:DNA polymerase III subunit beta [bacterium]
MKISSLQENLKSGLAIVSHIAGKNVNLSILNNIMIEAKDGDIKLISTDLEIGIVSHIRGKIEKEGVYTVESRLIYDYISLLPNKKIDIEKKDTKLIIKSDNYKTNIRGQEADEFPLIPQVDKKESYRANIDEFKEALSQVVFAVSSSETRIELTGVLFNFNSDKLTLAATDSYRLAEKKIKISSNANGEKSIIVPSKTLQELIRILGQMKSENFNEGEKEIEFYITENQILFICGNTELISRLIEGQYPDYRQIIPTEKETEAKVDRGELARAVKAAALFSKTGINDVSLDFPLGKKKIMVTASSSQAGENITELDADVSGKDNSIVVNYRYLLDGINTIKSEYVEATIINSSTPMILKSEKDDSYLYIIMPIKQ